MNNFLGIEHKLIPIVINMETTGFCVDKNKLTVLRDELSKSKMEIEYKYQGINLNSPKQVREYMIQQGYKKELASYTAYNQTPSVDKLVLKKLVNSIPMCKDLLEYREVAKLLGTYVEPMLLCDMWRGNFNQVGTITGRFSSSKPNLQNIPSRTVLGKRIRECLTARPGYKLIVSDLSQIEPRLYAFFSQDKKLLNVFTTHGDFHTDVTKTIYGLNGTPPTKDQRFVGKTVGLATLYGAGTQKLVDTLIKYGVFLTDKEVNNIRNKIKFNYREATDWYWRYKKYVGDVGHVTTILGRTVPMETGMNPVNTRIQGSCADIIKVNMANVGHDKHSLIAQVHDELICEAEEWRAGQVAREVSAIMEESVQVKGIHIKADTSVCQNWGEK